MASQRRACYHISRFGENPQLPIGCRRSRNSAITHLVNARSGGDGVLQRPERGAELTLTDHPPGQVKQARNTRSICTFRSALHHVKPLLPRPISTKELTGLPNKPSWTCSFRNHSPGRSLSHRRTLSSHFPIKLPAYWLSTRPLHVGRGKPEIMCCKRYLLYDLTAFL